MLILLRLSQKSMSSRAWHGIPSIIRRLRVKPAMTNIAKRLLRQSQKVYKV